MRLSLYLKTKHWSGLRRKPIKKETGARALRAIIEEFMLDIMYEIPKDSNIALLS